MNGIALDVFVGGFLISAGCILIGFLIESRRPARPQGFKAAFFNVGYLLPASFVQTLLLPVAAAFMTLAVNAAGGGAIALAFSGWRLFPSLLIYIFAMDFGEYIFHRAQHRLPLLWSMHSLHHSDPAINVSTTVRHYWAEHFIKSVTIYLLVGLTFKVNPAIVMLYSIIGFYNYFTHMNLRIGFGRWSLIVNSPQYHRIHHSKLVGHRDCNFAALFPVFDYIFGSYRWPRKDEFPPTGLDTHEAPSGVLQAMIWPFRRMIPDLARPRAR